MLQAAVTEKVRPTRVIVKETLIGAVETCGSGQRRKWLDKVAALRRVGE